MDRDYPTNYVPSNIGAMFGGKIRVKKPTGGGFEWVYRPEPFPLRPKYGPDLASADYRRRLRAELIQHLPGYAEALTDEIEAQLDYWAVPKGFRRSPDIEKRKVWFAARERLYKAREHTKDLTQLTMTLPQLAHMDWFGSNVDPVTKAFNEKLRAEWWAEYGPAIVKEARAELAREDDPEGMDWLDDLLEYECMPLLPFQVRALTGKPQSPPVLKPLPRKP